MKYYRLFISTDNRVETFDKLTEVLGHKPTIFENTKRPDEKYSTWTYCIDENEEDDKPSFDFINKFLDIIEPKFKELENLGIKKNQITFWLNYEYFQQCSLEFHPQEMKRLGDSEIALCIDCFERKE
jgi:hypothetical protein